MQGKISSLLKIFCRLPGINQRLSRKICFALIQNPELLKQLSHAIQDVQESVHKCDKCGMYIETELCVVCANSERDSKYICVVSDMLNLLAIEKTKMFKGVYHITNGLISNLDQVGPEQLNLKTLMSRVDSENVTDILIGFSPTVEGQTTAYYIKNMLKDKTVNVKTLGVGVSIGSDLEYLDAHTIAAAIKNGSSI